MAREEQINDEAVNYGNRLFGEDLSKSLIASFGFTHGAEWADNNPKSPWISVNDDLPCNHEELKGDNPFCPFTKSVLVAYEDGNVDFGRMLKDDKGNWKFVGNVIYWMPIPELPKESD